MLFLILRALAPIAVADLGLSEFGRAVFDYLLLALFLLRLLLAFGWPLSKAIHFLAAAGSRYAVVYTLAALGITIYHGDPTPEHHHTPPPPPPPIDYDYFGEAECDMSEEFINGYFCIQPPHYRNVRVSGSWYRLPSMCDRVGCRHHGADKVAYGMGGGNATFADEDPVVGKLRLQRRPIVNMRTKERARRRALLAGESKAWRDEDVIRWIRN
ncbi:hypothetical protein NA57DRAFT_78699 [Rhizodiscina lignyota]|uniref:Uncharacterized protein n=1 Tax=Rhizodiscina lignyota TaxID=1504668 RepID=A0A9P4IAY4_9PEZI|nr:hypothetical protein NA57DRAFT_78699 [Rhizodiscina lignyota]